MTPKYRVWDTRDERMLIVKEMYFGPNGPTAVRVLGNVSISPYKKTDFLRIPRGIVMQWTGLKDKNGTDIYEGDVLEFTDKWEWYRSQYSADFMFSVRGSKEEAELQAKYDAEPMHRLEVKYDVYDGFELTQSDVEQYYEVIGNIHATPELLNVSV